jgi:type III pantothenate kinase
VRWRPGWRKRQTGNIYRSGPGEGEEFVFKENRIKVMKPSIVVDIGNSRIKWGWCAKSIRSVSLPPDDPAEWQAQIMRWQLDGVLNWAVSSVHPEHGERLVDWIRQRGDSVWMLDNWRDLPVAVRIDHPEKVGMDRLLDAVAAKARVSPGTPAVIVDAGSAVTVDWLDETGAFCGGAIFPGLSLMARSLHDYTALLPLVQVRPPIPTIPANNTPAAMQGGMFGAVVGGIQALTAQLTARSPKTPVCYLTGGDSILLLSALGSKFTLCPDLTLEGIRITAENQP